jgi:hypothetical protein
MDILQRSQALCQALLENHNSKGFKNQQTEYVVEVLRKYYKIIHVGKWQRSVHAFVDKKTGDLYKPAGWNGPAKHIRFNLVTQFDEVLEKADCFGSYLYIK